MEHRSSRQRAHVSEEGAQGRELVPVLTDPDLRSLKTCLSMRAEDRGPTQMPDRLSRITRAEPVSYTHLRAHETSAHL
eukprot:6652737-Alexandrium_andersonii.AAC.1